MPSDGGVQRRLLVIQGWGELAIFIFYFFFRCKTTCTKQLNPPPQSGSASAGIRPQKDRISFGLFPWETHGFPGRTAGKHSGVGRVSVISPCSHLYSLSPVFNSPPIEEQQRWQAQRQMAELPLLGDGSEARGWRELGPDLPCWEGEAERRQQMEFGGI